MSDVEPGDTMVEALRRANPVAAGQAASRRSLPSANALFADIVAQRPRRVRTRVVAITIAVLLIALMAAAFVLVRRERPTFLIGASCYSAASRDARVVVVGGGDPRHECARLWTDGTFGSGAVPPFDVCVLPLGGQGVFPGESGSVCKGLGLSPDSGESDVVARALAEAGRSVSDGCFGPSEAEKIVKDVFDQYGVSGWKFARGEHPFNTSEPCASLATDEPTQVITIDAIPPLHVPDATTP